MSSTVLGQKLDGKIAGHKFGHRDFKHSSWSRIEVSTSDILARCDFRQVASDFNYLLKMNLSIKDLWIPIVWDFYFLLCGC